MTVRLVRSQKSAARKTIAVFCDAGFLAHVTRSFEVGRALRDSFGHEVVFCCDGPYAHIPRDAGFKVVPVFTVDRNITMKVAHNLLPPSLRWWKAVNAQSVTSDLDAIRTIDPDAIVGDLRWSLSTSARACSIPYVSIANACWTDKFAYGVDLPEGHFSTRIFGKRLAQRAFPAYTRMMMKFGALGYAEVRKKHGLPPVRTMWEAVQGDITLLCDLPEFMPVIRDTPPSFRYTGPLLWEANIPLPSWYSRLDRSRPTIYFTMGSTGDTKFFEEAVRVFGNTQFQVLITTGGLAEVRDPPPNVFIAKYAPGEALMAVSDVVVSHGGNGTVYQALSRGVPIIGLPSIFDQEVNMRRVCALGAGIQLSNKGYTGELLQVAVSTILNDQRYRDRCKQLAVRIARMDGRRRAALHIHDFLEHKDPTVHPTTATQVLYTLPPLPQSAVA
jgi:MGT family glycosyltransferase